MEYLNLHTSVMDSPEFVGADTIERGTWLSLQRYCIGQENSGLIEDCAEWKDRQWQQVARVTLREVRRKSRLFRWEGNNLRIFYYPQEAEDIVVAKRLVAQANGKLGGRPRKNPDATQPKPTLVISEKAKGKEKKGNEIYPPLPPPGECESGQDLQLIEKIKSLNRKWQGSPLLTAREARVFRANRGIFARFTEEDWEVKREFMRAKLGDGTAYFKPWKLGVYLEDAGSVLAHARDWKDKQRPKLAVLPDATPADCVPMTKEQVAAIFQPKRMNS